MVINLSMQCCYSHKNTMGRGMSNIIFYYYLYILFYVSRSASSVLALTAVRHLVNITVVTQTMQSDIVITIRSDRFISKALCYLHQNQGLYTLDYIQCICPGRKTHIYIFFMYCFDSIQFNTDICTRQLINYHVGAHDEQR